MFVSLFPFRSHLCILHVSEIELPSFDSMEEKVNITLFSSLHLSNITLRLPRLLKGVFIPDNIFYWIWRMGGK